MDCKHDPQTYDNSLVCSDCGLVIEDWYEPLAEGQHRLDQFSNLLDSPINGATLDNGIKTKVGDLYYKSLQAMNIKGRRSKLSLFSLCLFYTCITNSVFMTSKNVEKHLGISKSHMNTFHDKFMTMYPQFRILDMKPSDFVPMFFTKYGLPTEQLKDTLELCKKLDNETKFINSNPALVSFSLVFQHLEVPIVRKILDQEGFNHTLLKKMCEAIKCTLCLED